MANFVFNYSKEKVTERPINVLDKDPGDYDIITLEDEINQVLAKMKLDANRKKSNRPQRYDEQPIVMDLFITELKVARSIQRPFSMAHSLNIAFDSWDSRRPLFPIVVFNPLSGEYLIVEGNHTSISQGIRAATGEYPDVNKDEWRKLKVRCQVVVLMPDDDGNVDMSFCRDHFIGTNGDDRMALADFDIYQNLVLKVRQDYAGDIDKCEDPKAIENFNRQVTGEYYNLYPVHPRSGRNTMLAGAVNHLSAWMKLKIDDIDFLGKNHQQFWDNLDVDAIELLPMQALRRLINNAKSNPDEFHSKQHKQFMYEMAVVMQKFGTTPSGFRDFAVQVWNEFYNKTALVAEKKIPQPPKDFSLIIWLKLHQKVGGKYSSIPAKVYTKFIEQGIDAVDCLPKAKQKILKEF
jgi:hypothetical protein